MLALCLILAPLLAQARVAPSPQGSLASVPSANHVVDITGAIYFQTDGANFAYGVFEQFQHDLNGDGDMTDTVLHVIREGETSATNYGLALVVGGVEVQGGWVVFSVEERWQGERDLNGDGDIMDQVVHVLDLRTGRVRNLRIAGGFVQVVGDTLVCIESESMTGVDLNGDGDTFDSVPAAFDLVSGRVTSSRLAHRSRVVVAGEFVTFSVNERRQNEDLNGDGDLDDEILHLSKVGLERPINLGRALVPGQLLRLTEQHLYFRVDEASEGRDLTGDGDAQDHVLHVRSLHSGAEAHIDLHVVTYGIHDSILTFIATEEESGDLDLDGNGVVGGWTLHYADLGLEQPLGEVVNVGLPARGTGQVAGHRLLLTPTEFQLPADWNGDGDTLDDVLHVHDLRTRQTYSLGLAARFQHNVGALSLIQVRERQQGAMDLNGNGTDLDTILHVHDFSLGVTHNLRVAVPGQDTAFATSGDQVTFSLDERPAGVDLNGDGDHEDLVVHRLDGRSGRIENTGLAAYRASRAAFFEGGRLLLMVEERAQGADLNGDGDLMDRVILFLPAR